MHEPWIVYSLSHSTRASCKPGMMAGSQVEFSGLLILYATISLCWVPLGLAEINGQRSGHGGWAQFGHETLFGLQMSRERDWIIWLELFVHIRAQLDSPIPFATRQLPL